MLTAQSDVPSFFWFDGQGFLGQPMRTSTNPLPGPVKDKLSTPELAIHKKTLSCDLMPIVEQGVLDDFLVLN